MLARMNRCVALSVVLLACNSPTVAPSDTDAGGDPPRDAATADASGADAAAVDETDAGAVSCPPRSGDVVGVRDPSLLVPSDRIVVSESDTVIENVDVAGDIEIVDGATNVTIRNFRITTDGYWGIYVREGSGIVIEDGEIDGLGQIDDAIRGADYTARRLYIHDIEGDSFKADGRNLIECNYVTDIGQGAEAHGDGVQMMGDGDIVIRENNFELTSGSLTACIFPFGSDPVQGRVDLVGNRFNGGGWVVYCHTTVYARDNVWGPEYGYGAVTNECAEWVNNTWEADGTDVPY
jgi:hypothetical protein